MLVTYRTMWLRAALAIAVLLVGCTGQSQENHCGSNCNRGAEVEDELSRLTDSLSDEDRADKYCKMVASPFVFFRGSNNLFWKDFADDARMAQFGDEQTRIWIQGDLHAYNFGSFDDDDEIIIYDLNDFDEAVIADYQYDVWRLATSLVLIAEENGGFAGTDLMTILEALAESYLDTIADYGGNQGELSVRYTEDTTFGRLDDFLKDIEANESRRKMLDKWAPAGEGGVRTFDMDSPKLGAVSPETLAALTNAMTTYVSTTAGGLTNNASYFSVKSVARRLWAGTGSLGTARYYVLVEGASSDQDDDRILDVKLQGPPAAFPYLDDNERGLVEQSADNHAARVVLGHRALGANVDDHLGVLAQGDLFYSVRERSPYKEAFDTRELTSEHRFVELAEQWGAILATAHARSDRDFDPTLIDYSFDSHLEELTDGLHAEFDDLTRDVALEYAAQVNADYQAFVSFVEQSDIECPPAP